MGSRCWIQAATSLAFAVHRPSIGVPSSMSSTPSMFECGSKRRVSYFYDSEIGNYHYGQGHPMKPHRVRMAHNLIVNYGLYKHMDIFRPPLLDACELTKFHSDDYINFLRMISPDNMSDHLRQLQRCGAARLNHGAADMVINWGGGLHHAKKSEASGFCYVNDCVLGILELLKTHARVLYIDIDIHHGDGVEEAFYTSDRVMTCSFHKFGDYFPGTGAKEDIGYGSGKNTSINFPLDDGMNDEAYESVFRPIITKVFEHFRPSAVVMQCGADSLAGDRLGCFNLSIKGHAACVAFVRSFNVPTLVIGGGGYTIRNVARCWTYETAVCVAQDIPDELPYNDYFEYYGPDYRLHIDTSNMENKNTRSSLERTRDHLMEVLRSIPQAPSVQIQTGAIDKTPRVLSIEDDEDLLDPDTRHVQRSLEVGTIPETEYFDGPTDHDHADEDMGS